MFSASFTETVSNTDCAKLIGICLAKASGADLALISANKWYELEDGEDMNSEGVSGELYPVPVTDLVITSILPTGWNGTIQNVTLTGKRIKELVQEGYDRNKNGDTFPYLFQSVRDIFGKRYCMELIEMNQYEEILQKNLYFSMKAFRLGVNIKCIWTREDDLYEYII